MKPEPIADDSASGKRTVSFADSVRFSFPSELFRLYAENSGDVFWVEEYAGSEPGRILYLNPAFEHTWGMPVGKVYDDPDAWMSLVHPDDRDRIREEYALFLKGEAGFDTVYRLLKPGGQIRWIHDLGFVKGEKDDRQVAVGVARDITELIQRDQNEQERDKIFDTLTENTSDYILLIQDEQLVYYNRAFESDAGGTLDHHTLTHFLDQVAPEDRERVIRFHRNRVQGLPAPEYYEADIITLDGRRITCEIRAKKVIYLGRPAVLVVLHNITDRKHAEQSLQLAQQALESLPIGVFIYQFLEPGQLILLSGNPEAERLTGLNVKRFLGKEFNEIWPNANEAGITESYLQVARTGKTLQLEEQAYSDDRVGGYFRIRVFTVPGQRIAVAFDNITDHIAARKALQESEERLSQFINSATGLFSIWDSNFRLVDLNRAAEAMLPSGITREDALGMSMPDLANHPVQPEYQRVLDTGQSFSGQDSLTTPNGKRMILDVRAFKVGTGLGIIANDVTDRVEAEQAVIRSERWFRGLLKGIVDAVFVHRLNEDGTFGPFIEVNDVACKRLGYSREELIGMSPYDIDDPVNGINTEPAIRTLMKGDGAVFEQTLLSKDGRSIPVEISANLLRLEDATVVISIVRDISERRRAEAELRKLAYALDQSAEALVITDRNGVIEYVNAAFERITGYSRAEALGQNPRIIKSGKHDEAFYRELWETLLRGEVWEGHLINRHKNGSMFHERAVISPVRNEKGEIVSFIAAKRDITRELNLEQQLQQAQKMETVGNLAGGIAHDFNNLLTIISGNVDLLLLSESNENLRNELEEIGHTTERAAQLTRQLLAFSRKQVIKPCVLNLNHVLQQSEKLLRRAVGETVEFMLDLDDQLWTQQIDLVQLEQILVNLAVNARDAMPDGGRLCLRTRNVPCTPGDDPAANPLGCDHVLLEVADTGVGMDPDTAARIFEPFYTTKDVGKGTGLGLSTVHGIMEQVHGRISVETRPGEGCTFFLRFPKADVVVQDDSQTESRQADLAGNESVLLVEDDELVRRSTAKSLQRYGYRVIEAASAEHALQILGNGGVETPDVIITDVVMPRMKGDELILKLRENHIQSRFIFMSGYASELDKTRKLIEQGVPFIQKPFKPSEIVRLVRKILDEAKATADT